MQLARVLCQISEPVVDGKPCWLLLDELVSTSTSAINHHLARPEFLRTRRRRHA
ncbi:ABC-type hemin transport system ATPase subunit [Rhizobium binae]|uniref:ABC-type hemin transport system ATPase subunit n=1 Tax=Rhizobium binae TaxID=1138190 RepID=A0ABV2MLL2_9HYPH